MGGHGLVIAGNSERQDQKIRFIISLLVFKTFIHFHVMVCYVHNFFHIHSFSHYFTFPLYYFHRFFVTCFIFFIILLLFVADENKYLKVKVKGVPTTYYIFISLLYI